MVPARARKIWENSTSQITGWASDAATSMGVRRFRSRFRAPSATAAFTFTSRLMACSPPPPVGGREYAADRTGQRGLGAGPVAGVAHEHVIQRRLGLVERRDGDPFGAEQPGRRRGAGPGVAHVGDYRITRAAGVEADQAGERPERPGGPRAVGLVAERDRQAAPAHLLL